MLVGLGLVFSMNSRRHAARLAPDSGEWGAQLGDGWCSCVVMTGLKRQHNLCASSRAAVLSGWTTALAADAEHQTESPLPLSGALPMLCFPARRSLALGFAPGASEAAADGRASRHHQNKWRNQWIPAQLWKRCQPLRALGRVQLRRWQEDSRASWVWGSSGESLLGGRLLFCGGAAGIRGVTGGGGSWSCRRDAVGERRERRRKAQRPRAEQGVGTVGRAGLVMPTGGLGRPGWGSACVLVTKARAERAPWECNPPSGMAGGNPPKTSCAGCKGRGV